jgi:hypothetical protein
MNQVDRYINDIKAVWHITDMYMDFYYTGFPMSKTNIYVLTNDCGEKVIIGTKDHINIYQIIVKGKIYSLHGFNKKYLPIIRQKKLEDIL